MTCSGRLAVAIPYYLLTVVTFGKRKLLTLLELIRLELLRIITLTVFLNLGKRYGLLVSF